MVLRKRPAFREAFAQFDPEKVANFIEDDVTRLLQNAAIIRNSAKIRATINNARATLELRKKGGLVEFVWGFQPEETPRPRTRSEEHTSELQSRGHLVCRL